MQLKITGVKETQAMLAAAPKNIVLLGYARALKAGVDVLAAATIERTPILTGDLVQHAVTDVIVDANSQGGFARFGFGRRGFIALQVEYGHKMVGHKPGKKPEGEAPAHPFMRPAFDASAQAAEDAFSESLAKTLKTEY